MSKSDEIPIPMRIPCPECGELHIDEGEFATKSHHTHACQACGLVWRPAVVPTVGVRFLPGYRGDTTTTAVPDPDEEKLNTHLRDLAYSLERGRLIALENERVELLKEIELLKKRIPS